MKKVCFILTITLIFLFGIIFELQAATAVPKKVLAFSEIFGINVFWGRLNLEETERIVLLRKKETCPQNSADGERIYEGNGSGYLDKKAANRKNYCYGIFITDLSGVRSNLVTSDVVAKLNVWQYLSRSAQENRALFWGGTAVMILALLNLIKKRRKERRIWVER